MKKKIRRLTVKQEGFVTDLIKTKNATEAIVRNYNVKDRIVAKSMGSENLAKPCIQEKMKPIINQLENERLEALEEARKKRGTAQYSQLMQAVKDLTAQIQLLSGGSTERVTVIQFDDSFKK